MSYLMFGFSVIIHVIVHMTSHEILFQIKTRNLLLKGWIHSQNTNMSIPSNSSSLLLLMNVFNYLQEWKYISDVVK